MADTKGKNKRSPIVVVLGHVDHGKTTILDYIKKSNVAAGESGGITQHIGAYEIEFKGQKITFIDTPGHEAFSAMRTRGAGVADIAILVVAADEGVKPQTKEAIAVIQKAKVPFIVAINKIDKEGAYPEKVKRELATLGILVESMGGDITSINVSAKSGAGIEELLDMILLMAEMSGLSGNERSLATGVIIESNLDKKRGPIATLLVLDGTLNVGDVLATKTACGKVRILADFMGRPIKSVKPAQPCLVNGFSNVPGVGEEFNVYPILGEAEEWVKKCEEERKKKRREFDPLDTRRPLNLVLKVDVAGSIEAIEKTLEQLPQEEIPIHILRAEAGDITENDVEFAISTGARIVGFRVKAPPMIERLADDKKIRLMFFDIIYNLSQGVRVWQTEMIKPKIVRKEMGRIRVLAVFFTEGSRQIVGGRITDGEITKNLQIEIEHEGQIVGKGRNLSLQKNKKDIDKGVRRDEVAILFEGDAKIKEDDTLIFYGNVQT